MKRSEINEAIGFAKKFFSKQNFHLPDFAFFTTEDWKKHDLTKMSEIFDAKLGWDITDLGHGDFKTMGLTLFTIRNGIITSAKRKPYAEKIMISYEEQVTPMHYHWNKMEDIINRGGGNLIIQLYNRNPETDLLDEVNDVHVNIDGQVRTIKAGECVCLKPGSSICLPPFLYHSFWAEKKHGPVMAGEVSMVNDDEMDNRFLKDLGRFSTIEEDSKIQHLLCSDYEQYFSLN